MCRSAQRLLFLTLRVYILRQFESVRIGQVGVGGSDSQDQTALSGDELHNHVSDLLLDVCGLVPYRNLGDTRQVDESQVQHCNSGRSAVSEGISELMPERGSMFFCRHGRLCTLKGEEIL